MGLLCLTFVKLKIFHSKRWTLRCIMPTENKLDPLYRSTVSLPTTAFLQGTMVRWSVMDTKINAFSFQKAVGLSFLHISYCLEAPTTIGVTHTSRSWKIYLLTETRHLNKLFPSITNSFQWRQLVEEAFRKYLHQN